MVKQFIANICYTRLLMSLRSKGKDVLNSSVYPSAVASPSAHRSLRRVLTFNSLLPPVPCTPPPSPEMQAFSLRENYQGEMGARVPKSIIPDLGTDMIRKYQAIISSHSPDQEFLI